jgi:hypothetical protein
MISIVYNINDSKKFKVCFVTLSLLQQECRSTTLVPLFVNMSAESLFWIMQSLPFLVWLKVKYKNLIHYMSIEQESRSTLIF